ncbi:MAG: hypothetical protein VZQ75_01860, partial [Candidatus Faecousia sp.]|nr:hypothetical protein [Candidatus Faecousia sp.]
LMKKLGICEPTAGIIVFYQVRYEHSDQRRRSFRTAVKRRSLWRSPFSRLCSMSPPFRIEAPRDTSLAASRQFTSPASLGFDSVLL